MSKELLNVKLIYRCKRCNEIIIQDHSTVVDKKSLLKHDSNIHRIIHDCQYVRSALEGQKVRIVSTDKNMKAFGIAELIGYDIQNK